MFLNRLYLFKNTFLLLLFGLISCGKSISQEKKWRNFKESKNTEEIITGAAQIEAYLNLLQNKKVALVSNPTSVVFNVKNHASHLVDTLIKHQINIEKVFAPEHGFRGKADAGETVQNGIDAKTNIPIISIYGKNKKPAPQYLQGLDIVVFDIQDVGARFYTYISSLHYVMEACAENNIPLLILDRPNPNGHYIDGPILKKEHQSFVGLHPVPVVHGMTIGEYAQMINGEKWLANAVKCDLTVIPLKNYTHHTPYELPIKPSPNLPNSNAINLYPSLCFFEGTSISVGRGTNLPFQIYGNPNLPKSAFTFTPKPNEGAKYPKHENKLCYGKNLSKTPKLTKIELKWLLEAYATSSDKSSFFTPFFSKLAGNTTLQKQIEAGLSAKEITESWQEDLKIYNHMRQKYLIYPLR